MNLVNSVFSKDVVEVTKLLDHGADINAQGGKYGNALQAAASRGDEARVRLLLDRGADCNVQPWLSDRSSLLHIAIFSMNTFVLEELLANGARVHITSTDNFGQTPLHLAVKANQVEMVRCLLNEGASPDETDFTDTSVLQSAVQDGSRDIVLLLYPRAKSSLGLLTASDWQKHFNSISRCDLEVIDGEGAQVRSIDNLKDHVSKLSYPMPSFSITQAMVSPSHFMQQHQKARRML